MAADGTVDAVTPPSPDLDGIRLFTLSTADAAAITSVLRDASGSLPGTDPAPSASTSGNGSCGPPGARRRRQARRPPARSCPPRCPGVPAPGPAPSAAASPAAPAGAHRDSEPAAPEKRLVQLRLLGELRITAGGEEVSGGLRKARELLAFLAVHPDGASGEAISEALWPEASPDRVTGQRNLALRKAREMLRTATGLAAPMWIINASGRYRLDPALVGTDLQAFGDALDRARHETGDARLAACRTAAALYSGELAAGAGTSGPSPTPRPPAAGRWTHGPPSPRSSSPATRTGPCPPWRRPWPTIPTTSTSISGSCGCRPQRAVPRPSAGPSPSWKTGSPTWESRRAPRPARSPPRSSALPPARPSP